MNLHEAHKDLHSSSSFISMELVPNINSSSSEHLCYVRCNFCTTVLAVGIPCKSLMDTVTIKCGNCSNISFLTTRPSLQCHRCMDHHHHQQQQQQLTLSSGSTNTDLKYNKQQHVYGGGCPSSSSSSTHDPIFLSNAAQYVVKPPETKHRLPSAYNRFMKEEIQRIKSANPEIPHREAFSTAAKNWARHVPKSPTASSQQFPEISNDDTVGQ